MNETIKYIIIGHFIVSTIAIYFWHKEAKGQYTMGRFIKGVLVTALIPFVNIVILGLEFWEVIENSQRINNFFNKKL